MSSQSDALSLLNRYLDAVSRCDANAVLALLGEDVVFNTPCMPKPAPPVTVGRAAVDQTLQWVFAQVFKRFEWTRRETHASDDPHLAFAIAQSRVELHNGTVYSNDYMLYTRSREGLIVEHAEFFDTQRAAQAFATLAA